MCGRTSVYRHLKVALKSLSKFRRVQWIRSNIISPSLRGQWWLSRYHLISVKEKRICVSGLKRDRRGTVGFIEEIMVFLFSIKRSMAFDRTSTVVTIAFIAARGKSQLLQKSHLYGLRNISHSAHYVHQWDCEEDTFLGDSATCHAFGRSYIGRTV